MASPPYGSPPRHHSPSCPLYHPRSPRSPAIGGAAHLPTSPTSPLSSPENWWPGLDDSPISTLDGPITPSPVYSPVSPFSSPSQWYISPSYSPPPGPFPHGFPTSPDYCTCTSTTVYSSTTSLNYRPEEPTNDRDLASPPPAPAPPCYSTSPIYGNRSTAYSPTAPNCFPGESSNVWNDTSAAWGSMAFSPMSPGFDHCPIAYSPVRPSYNSPREHSDGMDDISVAHGVDATPEYCYCCSMPLEDCCCQAGDEDAPSAAAPASEGSPGQ